jgi:hypothetical protein
MYGVEDEGGCGFGQGLCRRASGDAEVEVDESSRGSGPPGGSQYEKAQLQSQDAAEDMCKE